MNAKIIVYFNDNGDASYRTFPDVQSIENFILEENKRPLLVDLAFEPRIASEVCVSLISLPPVALASPSIFYARLPENCKFYNKAYQFHEDWFAYPILTFFGQQVSVAEELDQYEFLNEINKSVIEEAKLENPSVQLKLSDFEFSVRTTNVISNMGFLTVGDLVTLTERELLRIPNFGRKSLREIQKFLDEMGLSLGMNPETIKISYPKNLGSVSGEGLNYSNLSKNFFPEAIEVQNQKVVCTIIQNFQVATQGFNE